MPSPQPGDRDAARVTLLSFDWDSCLFSYRLPRPSPVEVTSADPARPVAARTVEENFLGRMTVSGLQPDSPYTLQVRWSGGALDLAFRTLPAPVGPMRSSFVAMADPHVSVKTENRKGRLFIESASVLRDLVADFNDRGVDGVLVSGDLTNAGTPCEFAMTREIYSGLRCPLFAAPGDHDIHGGDAAPWTEAFGPPARVADLRGLCVATLDASSGFLGSEGRSRIEEALASDARALVLVLHPQLVPDDFIRHGKHKSIRDLEGHGDLLMRLRERTSLVYAGHQNTPSLVRQGRMMQLNLPQPVQFLCGSVLVREFDNGFYHTFLPIRSEALNEHSRSACEAAVSHFGEPQWEPDYRLGPGPGHLNFLFDTGVEPQGESR